MSGIPHHAADRVRGRASNYETPKKQRTPAKLPRSTPRLTGPTPRTTARATRLGIVNQDPMPASLPMGATREFVEFRTRRKERNAARLAKEPVPTLIPGGVNPFDTENLKKYVRKMYRAIDATVWTTNTPVKPGKVRFREDHEETLAVDQTQRTIMVIDEDEDEEEEVEQNSTIVLDDD